MRSILAAMCVLTFVPSTAPLCAADSQPAVKKIYSGALATEWNLETWGGCELTERKEAEGAADTKNVLALSPQEKATAWCGGTVSTSKTSASISDPIPLPLESLDKAFLVFKLNGLGDEFDRPSGGQVLQLSIGERIKDSGPWSECWKCGGYIGINDFLKGGSIDNDPASWQEVRIPLRVLTDGKSVRFLGRIAFQFVGAPPPAGVAIIDIAVEFAKE